MMTEFEKMMAYKKAKFYADNPKLLPDKVCENILADIEKDRLCGELTEITRIHHGGSKKAFERLYESFVEPQMDTDKKSKK